MIQELKNLDNFGSYGTGTTVFGYDPDSDKYGKISVNQIVGRSKNGSNFLYPFHIVNVRYYNSFYKQKQKTPYHVVQRFDFLNRF